MDDPTFPINKGYLDRLKKKHDRSGIPREHPPHPPARQLSDEQQDLLNRANRAIEALRKINDGRRTGKRPTIEQMKKAEELCKAYAELAKAILLRETKDRKQQS